ncbi:MAG: serine hydrolase [Pseudomonadota bacterium]
MSDVNLYGQLKRLSWVSLSLALLACSTSPPKTDETAAQALPAEPPGPTELAWRQPKEIVPGIQSAATPADASQFPDADALARAAAYSQEHAGMGLMTWYDGALVQSEFATDVNEATPFASYSMHKSLLAIAVLAAIEDGLIQSLDDPVGDYLAAWQNDSRGRITLRQLLTHSSGLKHYDFSSDEAKSINFSARIGEAALTFPLSSEPGESFQYSNINSLIVGLALQSALDARDTRYADYVSERIWQPMGNRSAALWLDRQGGTSRYHSGFEAGLSDWLNVGVMLLSGGEINGQRVLSQESVAMLFEPSATNPAYGLHVWLGDAWQPARSYGPGTPMKVIHGAPFLSPNVVFFDGFGGQRVYVVPEHRLVVARFGGVDFTYDDSAVVNHLLRGLIDARADAARRDYQSASNDSVYQSRFDALMEAAHLGRGLTGYDPLIPLPGASTFSALPTKDAAWLGADARDALATLADTTNTSALMIWHADGLVYSDFAEETDALTPLISRSLSKPLSVVAVGRAIERGYIRSLDQPAADFLTEWQGTPKAQITLRQLLQMRSGLAAQGGSRDPADIMNKAYLHPYHTEIIINDYPLTTVPGERYDYSNANAELIAPIIERATGHTYTAWLTREVLGQIGAAGGEIWVNRIGGTAHSGCCALLPSETWVRLSVLLLQNGYWNERRLLPEGFVQQMITPTPQYPHAAMGVYVAGSYVEHRGHANPDVSYGKVFHSEPYLAEDLYLFDGNGHQVAYMIPSHDLVVLRMGVAPPKDNPWDNAYLPNLVLAELAENTGASLVAQRR